MKNTLKITNIIALVITIIVNYISNTGILNGNTIASISARYQNLFTPAGYTFSIWGLIYLGLWVFVIYQGSSLFKKEEDDAIILQIGWWFVLSCIANCLWIIAFLYDFIGLSVWIMLLLLFSLIKIILNTRMELDDVPFKKIAFVWWPFSLYSGWITIALIANIAAWLTEAQWNRSGITEIAWTIIMICIAGAINLLIIWTRNMREFALVGAWALMGIAVANWNGAQSIVQTALAVTLILLVNIGIHAYKNRKSMPWRNWLLKSRE
ncbi:MAG TPA: hypothetical protein VEV16_08355 [Daejeonella sp.]|nr:hypothetical protein [Daejeonella sp.]